MGNDVSFTLLTFLGMNLNSPQDMYTHVEAEISGILRVLEDGSDDMQVAVAKQTAAQVFDQLSRQVKEQIAALQRHAEWDTFTIAFYGETNAGKSTIIELLRILLDEQSKAEARQQFRALQARHDITEEQLERLNAALLQCQAASAVVKEELEVAERKLAARSELLHGEITTLQRKIDNEARLASIWRRLWLMMVNSPEQKLLVQLQADAKVIDAGRAGELVPLQQRHALAQETQDVAAREFQAFERTMLQLANLADGAIIGNGRSDFTLATQDYRFKVGGQQFALLDVPGIEGKEDKVIGNIWAAVHKAHAVFYVTAKAAAPQSGDAGHKGTLEKIKEHLGAQSEVWTVFNKRITNTVQLEKDVLLSKDEQESLLVLDSKMREQLGEKYCGHISLSAQPAFLAAAECLVPGSQDARNKAKFENKLGRDELLQRSGAYDFRQVLTGTLVKDHKAKIRRSNANKANSMVKTVCVELGRLLAGSFRPLARKLEQEGVQTIAQLDITLGTLKRRLETRGEQAVSQFGTKIRHRIYARIDDDISNDDFEFALKRYLREEQEDLIAALPAGIAKDVEKFQESISDVMERFQEHTSELLDVYTNLRIDGMAGKFDLKIEIDNGVNVPGLLGALAGGLLMIWNPGGWIMIAVGAVTALAGAAKALWGMVSSEYKKAQQRKSTDANLNKITDQLRESMRTSLDDAMPQLAPRVAALKHAVQAPALQMAGLATILAKTEKQLTQLSKTMEPAGAK